MCNYKVLHYNDNGYVIRCQKCKSIQIAFGNVAMGQTEQEFIQFKKCVGEAYQFHMYDINQDLKSISLQTHSSFIQLVFSVNELKSLHHLLEQSSIILEADKLLGVLSEN